MACRFRSICLIVLTALSACASIEPNSDYVIVEPVKYVPPPAAPIPNYRFGWVTTSVEDAQRFRVRIGDQRYHDLIQPHRVNGNIPLETAISVTAAFAEHEVISRHLCQSASVPAESRKLVGPQGPWEIWMYVECHERSSNRQHD
jgi:hypothetical protein